MMRTVDFVDHHVFEFGNTLFPHALVLGDVDGDGDTEMVIASMEGRMCVYKGMSPTPWRTCSLGLTVTSVVVGDVTNCGKVHVVSISAEGSCSLFDFCADRRPESAPVQPVWTQRLPVNSSSALIFDVNGDGRMDLIIGRTDRTMVALRWCGETSNKGFHETARWQCPGQIGSLAVIQGPNDTPVLGISQPGGTFMTLRPGGVPEHAMPVSSVSSQLNAVDDKSRQQGSLTELLGSIRTQSHKAVNALCTHAGSLELFTLEESLWQLQTEHQLFALSKLDFLGDGVDEVVACAYDGYTYILDQQQHGLCFAFDGEVFAFTAGLYATAPNHNEPCLFYVTFGGKVHVYHNFNIHSMANLTLRDKLPLKTALVNMALAAGASVEDSPDDQHRQICSHLLYGT